MVTETRKAVIQALMKLEERNTAEGEFWEQDLLGKERGLGQFLLYGILRERGRIDEILNRNSKKPIHKQIPIIRCILRLGAFELKFSRAPAHACIDQAVELSKFHGQKYAAGFVNAVLRKTSKAELSEDVSCNVPTFIQEEVKKKLDSVEYAQWLRHIGQPATITIATKNGEKPNFECVEYTEQSFVKKLYTSKMEGDVQKWDGFQNGDWWIMSPSSAMVIEKLAEQIPEEERGGLRVLDACAAPGSKSVRLVQYGFSVEATDKSSRRLQLLQENATRMSYEIPMHVSDWLEGVPSESTEEEYDVIVLDAPCSGLGVLRRHPEIRWRRTKEDISVHAIIQKQLIDALLPKLKTGGLFVYSVCSFFEEERGFFPSNCTVISEWETPLASGEDAFFISVRKKEDDNDRKPNT